MGRLITLPSGLFCLIIILVFAALFWGSTFLIRKFSKRFTLMGNDSMEANLLIRLGQTIFAVLLGFVVITIWVDYDRMGERTSMEATTLGNLYRDSRGLGEADEKKIQGLTRQYVHDIIHDAWPKMMRKEESKKAWQSFNILYGEIIRYQPKTTGEEIVLKRMVEHLNELANFRRLRHIRNNTPKVPGLFWGLIIISCSITIITSCFFYMKNLKIQVLITSLLSIMLGLIFSNILLMNYPYRSSLRITPYPFEQLLNDVFPEADITTRPSQPPAFSDNNTTPTQNPKPNF